MIYRTLYWVVSNCSVSLGLVLYFIFLYHIVLYCIVLYCVVRCTLYNMVETELLLLSTTWTNLETAQNTHIQVELFHTHIFNRSFGWRYRIILGVQHSCFGSSDRSSLRIVEIPIQYKLSDVFRVTLGSQDTRNTLVYSKSTKYKVQRDINNNCNNCRAVLSGGNIWVHRQIFVASKLSPLVAYSKYDCHDRSPFDHPSTTF